VVKQLPTSKVHKRMFQGAGEKFRSFPMRQQHADRVNKVGLCATRLVGEARQGCVWLKVLLPCADTLVCTAEDH